MGNFRATVTFTYEFESDQPDIVDRNVESKINELLSDFSITKMKIRIDKLRQRLHKIKLGEFTVEEVLPYVASEVTRRDYQVGDKTYSVRMNSSRYFVFRESIACVCCGLLGTKMILEQHPTDKTPHFNLYGVEDHKLVLMTKDHILAKAYGGSDSHSNFQTMCAVCNNLKGSENITLESLWKLRQVWNENRKLPKKEFRKLIESTRQSLVLPHNEENRIARSRRKFHLAKVKSDSKWVYTSVSLKVWRDGEKLIGRSIYQPDLENCMQVACINEGTKLETVAYEQDKILVKFGDENLSVYQSHLVAIEEKNECIGDIEIQ